MGARRDTTSNFGEAVLSKSFIQIVRATGGDIQQVTDLALEIAAHPDTIRQCRGRQSRRRRGHHLAQETEIDFGGTGEEMPDMPPKR
jgi:hypothetical protein